MAILVNLILAGCDSGWSGVHPEAGPVPLSSPGKPIHRFIDRRTSFEIGEERRLYWDEGNGPFLAQDRIAPLLAAIPNELHDRLYSTRDVPASLYPPLRGGHAATTYEYIYDTWIIVVSLNPDVLMISALETPVGPHSKQPRSWDPSSTNQARREYLERHVEGIPGGRWPVDAGTLIPWSEEMYLFSTDPGVKSGRLTFENNRAEVLLPVGKLMLVRRGEDVEVARE
jgi:hypothetical protein